MATTEPAEQVDHRELVDWVAQSSAHGSDRRLHKIDEDTDTSDLQQGDPVEVACDTNLVDEESYWRAKAAAVFPPGYRTLCDDPDCFGSDEE